jgi:hypothetical protein
MVRTARDQQYPAVPQRGLTGANNPPRRTEMLYPLSPAQFESLSDREQRDFLSEQERLSAAMRNRLEALAEISGKGVLDAQIAINDIFADLESAQANLRPMTLAYQEAIREWKMGKKPYSSSFGRDFTASLVRWEKLRLGIGCRKVSEERALQESIDVTYASLSKIEQRAADIVRGERRVARGKSSDPALMDPASMIAKAVREKWLTPTPVARQSGWEGGDDQECILTVAAD